MCNRLLYLIVVWNRGMDATKSASSERIIPQPFRPLTILGADWLIGDTEMAQHTISAAAEIPAPADLVYAIIADYRDGHPQILPKPPFAALVVDQGGIGAGTTIRFQMRLLGLTRAFRATIAEPAPGHTLL